MYEARRKMTPRELLEMGKEERFSRLPNLYRVALLEMRDACLEEIEIAKKGVPKGSETDAVLDVLIQQIKEGTTNEK